MKKYLLNQWKSCLFVFLTAGGKILCQLATAFIGMQTLQAALDRDFYGLVRLLVINGLFWAGFALCEKLSATAQARVIARMNNQLRQDISGNIIARSYGEFRQNNVGDYIAWYAGDVTQAEAMGFEKFFAFTKNIIAMLFSVVALLSIHWVLVVITLGTTFALLQISKLMDKKLEEKSAKVSVAMEHFTDGIKTQISGLSVLRVFGLTGRYQQKVGDISQQLEQSRFAFAKARENSNMIVSFVNIICQLLVNLFMFGMCVVGMVPFTTIFGGGNITALVTNSTMNLGQLRLALVSAKPFFEKHKPREKAPVTGVALAPLQNKIALEDVSFGYGEKTILNQISMVFQVGKKYALLGPSGCGKTTILRLLLGQLPGYSGKILYDNQEQRTLAPDELTKQFAYIEQDVYLFDTSIEENITLGGSFTQVELERALEGSALAEDLKKMPQGLQTQVGENGQNLSGGQRQRIAIARALIYQKSILLVDEGTSALDQSNAQIVENALLKSKDLTLVLISHHLSEERKARMDGVYDLGKRAE